MTRTLTINLVDLNGEPLSPDHFIQLSLSASNHGADASVIPSCIELHPDSNGEAVTQIVPSTAGETAYLAKVLDPNGQVILNESFFMPDADSELNDILSA